MRDLTALNAARRDADLAAVAGGGLVDVLVIGGGITGAGIALDAASRGLTAVLVEKHDLAFGTSRWSSKLVHGGLRYLATGNVGIARRSAVERGILMTRNAPHLVHAMPQLVPLFADTGWAKRALVRTGFVAGDGLRALAGTRSSVLPRSRRIGADEALAMTPTLRRDALDGALLAYDGQLIDDARLVVAVVRTAGSEIAGFTMADFEKASWTRTAEGGAQLDILLTPAATQRLREASGKAKAKGSELFLAATWDGARVEPRTRLHGEIGAITIRNPQLPDPAGWAAEVTRLVNADRR